MLLSNKYKYSIGSYLVCDEEKVKPSFIYIDELLESTLHSFLCIMFKWSKEYENREIWGDFFIYILYLMNNSCILGKMQDENANEFKLNIIKDDIQVLNIAEECYWTMIAFTMAHELAHEYFRALSTEYPKKNCKSEEFDADAIAYHIILKIIMEPNHKPDRQVLLEKYSYLAPVMYMDFFDLYYYTDRVLYNKRIDTSTHPKPLDRKNRLIGISKDEKYDFDTEEGNILYNGFLDVYDAYRDQILLKKERGKLNGIINKNRLNT